MYAKPGLGGQPQEGRAAGLDAAWRNTCSQIDRDGDGYIGESDVVRQLAVLDVSVDRSEARDMIFEVDEDRDGLVGWDDFANMWVRLKQPFTAITLDEPRRLFNLVDYLFEADIKRGKKKVTPPAARFAPPPSLPRGRAVSRHRRRRPAHPLWPRGWGPGTRSMLVVSAVQVLAALSLCAVRHGRGA